MKLKLLNNGSYSGFGGVSFPVEVNASPTVMNGYAQVHESELARIGCDMGYFADDCDPLWPFPTSAYEVIE